MRYVNLRKNVPENPIKKICIVIFIHKKIKCLMFFIVQSETRSSCIIKGDLILLLKLKV